MKLTEADIRLIKYEKRFGYIFAGLILSMGAFLNLFYFVASAEKNLLIAIPVDFIILILSGLVVFFMNRKLNQDLKADYRKKTDARVGAKQSEPVFKPGARGLKTEIVGNMLPEALATEDETSERYYLIIDNHRYEVSRNLYQKVEPGDSVKMYFSAFSETYLGMEGRINQEF
ncbi:MAG: hypothetical protein CVU14_07010 [Bacteroidetes bacterium HGW-Bacteroidetes-9]|jgi:hypothetical protein|nr:MAG: hypothetical protein CVU14_07010 [Bacteroidetes bacterium HGW-Bacteroidetes-9]